MRVTIEYLGKDLGNAKHPLPGVPKMSDLFPSVVRRGSIENMPGAPRYLVVRPK